MPLASPAADPSHATGVGDDSRLDLPGGVLAPLDVASSGRSQNESVDPAMTGDSLPQQPSAPSGPGASAEIDTMGIEALFTEAVAGPALTTLPRVPALFTLRYGDLLKQCLLDDVATQLAHAKAQRAGTVAAATESTQKLWLLSTLAFRLNGLGVDDGKQQTKILRARFQSLEGGDWQSVLKQYVAEKRQVDFARRQAAAIDATAPAMTTARSHAKVTEQDLRGKVAVARGILEGKQKAPATQATADHVSALVAAPAPDSEEADFAAALVLAKQAASKASEPKTSAVRRRLFLANANAEPGPSCMRNCFVQTLGSVKSGVHALQQWLALWSKNKLAEYAQSLWGRVVLIPIQDSVRPRDPADVVAGHLPTVGAVPKLRPIGLAECLLKVGEGAKIDPLMAEVRRHLEPNQLGLTADGVVL